MLLSDELYSKQVAMMARRAHKNKTAHALLIEITQNKRRSPYVKTMLLGYANTIFELLDTK